MSGGETRTTRVETLFHEASGVPVHEREAFLRERAGEDPSIVREVLDLLALADDTRGSFLETPLTLGAVEGGAGAPVEGTEIGSYRLVRALGEGGMGVVYLAEQQSPRRSVALKVIRAHLGSEQARRRFAHEAQALGRLHHPGVAQIFEARLDGARPFFAMEYVEGEPLSRRATSAGLSARERLALVAEIADAVQHAHERGIVHRDLKPGNILVTSEGRPKVLDFGVSRLIDDDLRLNTLRTEAGQLLGTVAYMSPEQASGDPAAVDARTDVYSLGVIAFELLTGRLPFDLAGKSLPEATRIVSEAEPATLGAIDRSLRGDFETIVRTAMERDRNRRYQSAAALADDIRRALRDEPIHARPPSAVYQFRKFAARNRAMVGAAAAVFAALVLGIAGTSVGLARSLASERRAREAASAEEAARLVAEREAATAKAINDFLVDDLLRAPAPFRRGRDVRVADVLDDAARTVESLAGQPLVMAEVRAALGEAYLSLELLDEARTQLTLAREVRVRELGADHPQTLLTDGALARVDVLAGRLQQGLDGLYAVAEGQRAALGPDHSTRLKHSPTSGSRCSGWGATRRRWPSGARPRRSASTRWASRRATR